MAGAVILEKSGKVVIRNVGLMLSACPGVWCAGEMLDWDAPTGGYLLQGTFSIAVAAARGVVQWLGDQAGGEPGG